MLSAGLPDDLELHHIIVNDWKRGVAAEQNVVLVSIASVGAAFGVHIQCTVFGFEAMPGRHQLMCCMCCLFEAEGQKGTEFGGRAHHLLHHKQVPTAYS
jgi:hypothetical protein